MSGRYSRSPPRREYRRDSYERGSRREEREEDGEKKLPPDISSMISLKVDNLTYRTRIEDLKPLFAKYGEVGDIYIPRNYKTQESRGFAFVRYYNRREAEDAMDRLDGWRLDGREIRVSRAQHARPEGASGGDGGRGGGGRYSRRSRSRSRSPQRRSRSPRGRDPSPRGRDYDRSRSRSPR